VAELVAAGLRSVKDLEAAAQSIETDPRIRMLSAWAIGRLRSPGWVGVLAGVMATDPHPMVVHAAALALLASRSSLARRSLRAVLVSGTHPANRAEAAWALGEQYAHTAVPLLLDRISNPKEATEVRAEAAEALGYLRDPSALEPLIRLLDDPSSRLRFEAVFALGTIADAKALPALERLADDQTEVGSYGRISDAVIQAKKTIAMLQPPARRRAPSSRKRSAMRRRRSRHSYDFVRFAD
jgi:HEAT repeat protein